MSGLCAMIPAVTPAHDRDAERLRVLRRYDVLDSGPRRELETLVELAAIFTGVPMATINLITDAEQVQVATYGFTGSRWPRKDSLCTTVVDEQQPVIVEDARLDQRFATHPATTGERDAIRFYGAHPLVTPEGVTIGTLCVYDRESHQVTPQVADALKTLADRVVDVLELELTSRRLAAANERLGAFAGQISHDLRNPLASVQMAVEMAHEHVVANGQDETLLRLLERAERGAKRMDDMIGEVLSFATVGNDLSFTKVDLAVTVAEVVEDLKAATTPHPVDLQDLPIVWGDPVQLRVVLQNVLSNAMKFSPAGTPIVVAATPLERGWRITIADEGQGVPPEARERVFDPMVRLDAAVPGVGIGLATCRRIIEAHGGAIGLADHPDGVGTQLWFDLPDHHEPSDAR